MPFARIMNILEGQANRVLDMAEIKMNPETKGINALSAALALLVMADRVAEEEEKEAVSEFLIDLDIVIEKGLIREVAELFLHHITRLETAYATSAMEGNIVVGEVLKDVALIKNDTEYCGIVADTVNLVTSGSQVDPAELKTRERILRSLGKTK